MAGAGGAAVACLAVTNWLNVTKPGHLVAKWH